METSSAYGSVYFTSAMSTTYQGPMITVFGGEKDRLFTENEYQHSSWGWGLASVWQIVENHIGRSPGRRHTLRLDDVGFVPLRPKLPDRIRS